MFVSIRFLFLLNALIVNLFSVSAHSQTKIGNPNEFNGRMAFRNGAYLPQSPRKRTRIYDLFRIVFFPSGVSCSTQIATCSNQPPLGSSTPPNLLLTSPEALRSQLNSCASHLIMYVVAVNYTLIVHDAYASTEVPKNR